MKSTATATVIGGTIRKHLAKLCQPCVLTVRPGFQITLYQRLRAHDPAAAAITQAFGRQQDKDGVRSDDGRHP